MNRTPHEGMRETALRILTQASEAYPDLEKTETFAKIVDSILEQVGANFRIVLEPLPEENQDWQDTGEALPNDLIPTLKVHLKKINSFTWGYVAKELAEKDALWKEVPFKPSPLVMAPVATWFRGMSVLFPEAFGPEFTEVCETLEKKCVPDEEDVRSTHPLLIEDTQSRDDEWKRRYLLHSTLVNDLFRPGRKGHPIHHIRSFARLAHRFPSIERHARLHAINALRLHQVIAVTLCVSQGLRTLRDTDYIKDSLYFSRMLESLRDKVLRLHRAIVLGGRPSESSGQAMLDAWNDAHPDEEETDIERSARVHDETVRAAEWFQKQMKKDDLDIVRLDADKETVKAFLRAFEHAENPPEEVPQKLRAVLEVERCREELESVRRMADADALGAKEHEILSRIMSGVLRFQHSHPRDDVSEPDENVCTPRYIREHAKINCFTGPWLAAAMLLESGFREEQILYCDVQGGSGNVAGTHGSLLVMLSSGQQVVFDVGFKRIKNVQLGSYDEQTRRHVDRMLYVERLKGERSRVAPVRAALPDDVSQKTGIHSHMYVMPMRNGFAWGTLVRTGTIALEKKDPTLGRHAFELAHGLHPDSPDVLCGLGRCCKEEGDNEEALAWMNEALRSYPRHLMSRYWRAVLLVERREYAGALEDLEKVIAEPQAWYAGKHHRARAAELLRTVRNILHVEQKAVVLSEEGTLQDK